MPAQQGWTKATPRNWRRIGTIDSPRQVDSLFGYDPDLVSSPKSGFLLGTYIAF